MPEGNYKSIVVEVACLVSFDELSRKDVDQKGICIVDGSYLIQVSGESIEQPGFDATEAALDVFHSNVPISGLEHFSITTREPRVEDYKYNCFREIFTGEAITREAGPSL